MQIVEADTGKPALDERRMLLDERKQTLDESFPKKWGAVLFTAAATVAVSVVTATSGYLIQRNQIETADTQRQSIEANKKVELEKDSNRRSIETAKSTF